MLAACGWIAGVEGETGEQVVDIGSVEAIPAAVGLFSFSPCSLDNRGLEKGRDIFRKELSR